MNNADKMMSEWIAEQPKSQRRRLKVQRDGERRRFWADISFCLTLFWAMRKSPGYRVGQLIDLALAHGGKSLTDDHLSLFFTEDEELSTYLEEYTHWINTDE